MTVLPYQERHGNQMTVRMSPEQRKKYLPAGTGEVYGPAVQISPVSTEEQEETDAKPVNGSVAKSFKETKVWYRNPFIWIGTATALAVIGIFGYHLKKRG